RPLRARAATAPRAAPVAARPARARLAPRWKAPPPARPRASGSALRRAAPRLPRRRAQAPRSARGRMPRGPIPPAAARSAATARDRSRHPRRTRPAPRSARRATASTTSSVEFLRILRLQDRCRGARRCRAQAPGERARIDRGGRVDRDANEALVVAGGLGVRELVREHREVGLRHVGGRRALPHAFLEDAPRRAAVDEEQREAFRALRLGEERALPGLEKGGIDDDVDA